MKGVMHCIHSPSVSTELKLKPKGRSVIKWGGLGGPLIFFGAASDEESKHAISIFTVHIQLLTSKVTTSPAFLSRFTA